MNRAPEKIARLRSMKKHAVFNGVEPESEGHAWVWVVVGLFLAVGLISGFLMLQYVLNNPQALV